MTELHLTEFVQKAISSEARSGSQLIANVKWIVRSELAKGYQLIEHAINAHQYEIEGKNQYGGSQLLATQALQLQLSHLLSVSGKAKAATELLYKLLRTSTKLWGEESNPVIECRASLGIILAEQGHWEQSIETDEQTLAIMSRVLDDNDPRRLQIMYGLSYRLSRYWKAQEAEELQRQLLDACTRTLGLNHPDTVLATEILAYTICAEGKYEEAERLQNAVLKARRRVLGADNDITVLAMINLSSVLSRLPGKIDEALELQQEASKETVKSYGETHPFSVEQMDGLAIRQEQGGLIQEAIRTRMQIFQIRPDQSNRTQILAAMGNHATLLKSQGQQAEAEILITKIIEQTFQHVQKDEQISELAMKGLANAFLSKEGFDEASEAIYARCMALYKTRLEALGGEHPDTQAVASILGVLQGQGRVVQTCLRVLGLDQITTQNALNRLVNRLVGLQALDTESLKLRSEVLDLVGARTGVGVPPKRT
ncbi:hypothetical protein MMC28_008054 [Mycoblastus sanguinarius]|nr:hypothetical protein [Mycoblastus sanguinarius]